MASHSQRLTAPSFPALTGRNGLIDRWFYFAMALLIAVITVYGFSRTVDQSLFQATPPRPFLLWVHGAVFTSWIALYIVQSALIRSHNVKWHRSLGWFGVALGTLMVPLGVAISILMGRFHINRLHESRVSHEAFLISPLFDMMAFGILFGLAVYWRRKPDLHRRFMLIATCGLTTAAFGRFPFVAVQTDYNYVCVDALILLGVLRDILVERRVHKVYLYAMPLLAVGQTFMMFVWLNAPNWWVRIANTILG